MKVFVDIATIYSKLSGYADIVGHMESQQCVFDQMGAHT